MAERLERPLAGAVLLVTPRSLAADASRCVVITNTPLSLAEIELLAADAEFARPSPVAGA